GHARGGQPALLLRQLLGGLLIAPASSRSLLASPARAGRLGCRAEEVGRFRVGYQDLLERLLLVGGTVCNGHVIALLENGGTQDPGGHRAPGWALPCDAGVTNRAGIAVAVVPSRGVERRGAPAAVERHPEGHGRKGDVEVHEPLVDAAAVDV